MSTINHLLDKISNAELRDKLQAEFAQLQKDKHFGLVFEEHFPDATLLYEVDVRRGQKVTLKDNPLKEKFEVVNISNGLADCISLEDSIDGEIRSIAIEQLLPFADFGDPIYPYLQSIDKISTAPESNLWHEVIEADNYHALQLLAYLYPGKVDCIYIDPPYNTGARDWKYNNDYVDSNDAYRHSKWLSMMKKRLLLAKRLLNPKDSVLIITIDEKEYVHLGALLEEMFPFGGIQMVTSVISGKGVSRDGQFSRVEEYIYVITFGEMNVGQLECNMLTEKDVQTPKVKNVIDFLGFRRRNKGNYRTSRPNQFYPVFVDNEDGHIVGIGDAITPDINRLDIQVPDGCTALWPLDPSGSERIWSLIPESARNLLNLGCLKVTNWKADLKQGSVKYLASGMVNDILSGTITVDERDQYGAIISGHKESEEDDTLRPRRVWNLKSHNASSFGTLLIKKFLSEKRFDFPKSLYAVHDTLRFFVANKPNALIVDFFAGSGTTLHAVNLLNAEDGGSRRCIMVTNNEVGDTEEKRLKAEGKTPLDQEWINLGIARYVTWPRTVASVTGKDVNGNPVSGEYLTYLTKEKKSPRKFKKISFVQDFESLSLNDVKDLVSILTEGKIAKNKVTADTKYIIDEDCNISVLLDDSYSADWLDELDGADFIKTIIVLTKDNKLFNTLKHQVTELLGPVTESEPLKLPMEDGFKTNVEFFHLGFLDKRAVERNRQFREILPLLWLKADGIGKCPEIGVGELPPFLVFNENKFAVLINEDAFFSFEKALNENPGIEVAYIITNSDHGYKEMVSSLSVKTTYQLYRDYLDNFKINYTH